MRPPTLDELLAASNPPEGAEAFPCQITVFCDECGVEETGDYVVHTGMNEYERLNVARRFLADYRGWTCGNDGDFCFTCEDTGGAIKPQFLSSGSYDIPAGAAERFRSEDLQAINKPARPVAKED